MPTPEELAEIARQAAAKRDTAGTTTTTTTVSNPPAAAVAAAGAGTVIPAAGDDNKKEAPAAVSNERRYQLQSAPCTFCCRDGFKYECVDGVLKTDNVSHIEELEAAVKAGNIYHYGEQLPLTKEQLVRMKAPLPYETLAQQ